MQHVYIWDDSRLCLQNSNIQGVPDYPSFSDGEPGAESELPAVGAGRRGGGQPQRPPRLRHQSPQRNAAPGKNGSGGLDSFIMDS